MTAASHGQPDLPARDTRDPALAADVSARISHLHEQYGDSLRRFLWGVLRDHQLANDVLQATFVTLLESGGPEQQDAEQAWLYRVAYHQALAIRRREAAGDRRNRRLAEMLPADNEAADLPLLRREQLDGVRQAVGKLPVEQRQIVRMRIYENKTFAEIAAELNIPLGTALSRMRAALKKLRTTLAESEDT